MPVVLITGTSSGIGLQAAIELAARGQQVVATMRDLSRGGELQHAASEAGVEVDIAQLDVTDDQSVQDCIATTCERHGRIDVLVNNAGMNWIGPLELMPDEAAMQVIQTNLMGPFRVSRAVLGPMRAQGHGRIVNVGSIAADSRLGFHLAGMYVASKQALRGLTLEMAKEVTRLGIEVVLLEGGIRGLTKLSTTMLEQAEQHATHDTPYSFVTSVAALQAQAMIDALPAATAAAQIIADACTAVKPALRYPAAMQLPADAMAAITDDEYIELCAGADPMPILQRHGITLSFWPIRPTDATVS